MDFRYFVNTKDSLLFTEDEAWFSSHVKTWWIYNCVFGNCGVRKLIFLYKIIEISLESEYPFPKSNKDQSGSNNNIKSSGWNTIELAPALTTSSQKLKSPRFTREPPSPPPPPPLPHWPAPQPLSGLGLHSKTRTTALPLNPQRPNYSDCWRNHKKMQSYFALIEDVFNTLQGPLRPHYESDETAKPLQREFKTYICVWQRRRALWSGGLDALTGGGGGVNSEMSHLWNNTHKTNRSLTNVKTFWFVGKQQHFNAVDIRGAASLPGSRARLNKATC